MSGELRRYRSGEALTAARLNEAVDALNAQRHFRAGRGLRASSVGGVVVFELDPSALPRGSGFWAKIGTSTGAAHQWAEQELTAPFGWQDKSGGRSSAISGVLAYEANGREKVPEDTIVWLDIFQVASGSGPDPESQFALFDLTAGLAATRHPLEIRSDEVASTDAWAVNDQPLGYTGVDEKQLQRIYAGDPDGSTDPAWFSRLLTYDSNGNLTIIGQETVEQGATQEVITSLGISGNQITGTKVKLAVLNKGSAGALTPLDLPAGAFTDHFVSVDATDADYPGYLSGKLVGGAGVTLTPSGSASARILTIDATGDHLVAVSSGDTTPNYLYSKLAAGSGISLSKLNAGGNEQVQIASTVSVFGTHVSPFAITPTPEGSETADGTTWAQDGSHAGPPATDGVTIRVTTRVVYNDAGDKVLYGYYRLLTFDSNGLLYSIGGETRYTIDSPTTSCP